MARYDRIAPLSSPTRDSAFPAWLVLRDIEGLDTEETARVLDTTPNAVKIRLHRARAALRTLLAPHLGRGEL